MIAWMALKVGPVLSDVLYDITLKGQGLADLPLGPIFYEPFPPVFDSRKVGWENSCPPPQPNGRSILSGILRNWSDHRFFLAVELLEREISVFPIHPQQTEDSRWRWHWREWKRQRSGSVLLQCRTGVLHCRAHILPKHLSFFATTYYAYFN